MRGPITAPTEIVREKIGTVEQVHDLFSAWCEEVFDAQPRDHELRVISEPVTTVTGVVRLATNCGRPLPC